MDKQLVTRPRLKRVEDGHTAKSEDPGHELLPCKLSQPCKLRPELGHLYRAAEHKQSTSSVSLPCSVDTLQGSDRVLSQDLCSTPLFFCVVTAQRQQKQKLNRRSSLSMRTNLLALLRIGDGSASSLRLLLENPPAHLLFCYNLQRALRSAYYKTLDLLFGRDQKTTKVCNKKGL